MPRYNLLHIPLTKEGGLAPCAAYQFETLESIEPFTQATLDEAVEAFDIDRKPGDLIAIHAITNRWPILDMKSSPG